MAGMAVFSHILGNELIYSRYHEDGTELAKDEPYAPARGS